MKNLNLYIKENIFDVDDTALNKTDITNCEIEFENKAAETNFKKNKVISYDELKNTIYEICGRYSAIKEPKKFIIAFSQGRSFTYIKMKNKKTDNLEITFIYNKRTGWDFASYEEGEENIMELDNIINDINKRIGKK